MLGTGSKVILSESIQLLSTNLLFYNVFRDEEGHNKRSFHKDPYSFTWREKHAINYTGHRRRLRYRHRMGLHCTGHRMRLHCTDTEWGFVTDTEGGFVTDTNEASLHRTQNEASLHRTQNEGWSWDEEEPVSCQEPELNPERFWQWGSRREAGGELEKEILRKLV